MKEDPDAFQLHPDCYAVLRDAWKNGVAFFETTDCYGEPVTVKLGQVVAISRSSPEVRRQVREDRATDKLRDGDA
jgi:hypothetical protein